jgi:hypothetical protein
MTDTPSRLTGSQNQPSRNSEQKGSSKPDTTILSQNGNFQPGPTILSKRGQQTLPTTSVNAGDHSEIDSDEVERKRKAAAARGRNFQAPSDTSHLSG